MTGQRVLPRSLDPLLDESISGYLLRLAHRLGIPAARLLAVTGLTTAVNGSDSSQRAPLRLHIDAEPAARQRFARAARLTGTETDALFLAGYASRYPPARARPEPRGGKTHLSQWLLTTSTRFCPRCLTGSNTKTRNCNGGAWRRAWRLPVVFACTIHRNYLQQHCTAGHPVHYSSRGPLPRWHDPALHPMQCRADADPRPQPPREMPACGVWLPDTPPASAPAAGILRVQRRILAALDPDDSDDIAVLGRPTTPGRYFTDLIQLSYLIRRSWPLARDLMPDAVLSEVVDRHLTEVERQITEQCHHDRDDVPRLMQRLHRAPPADPMACAALLSAADRMLALDTPRELTGHLRHLLTHDQRRAGRADWTRQFLEARPDSSEGLRQAVAPILQTYARNRRSRALRTPIRRTPFGPEHIAQFLQPDWFHQFLAHFDGINTTHLRRTAALHLCQMAAGGSVSQAAVRLGLPDTTAAMHRCYSSVGLVHAWARKRGNPHEFETAVHDLADHIEASTRRIDYHRRRTALHNWCIDVAAWRDLVARLPEPEWIHGRDPELGDRKRQSASIIVWSRLTSSEHLFAPHPIRDQLPAHLRNAWRLSAYAMFARFRDGCTRPHDIALDRLLVEYATRLANDIDGPDDHAAQATTIRRPSTLHRP